MAYSFGATSLANLQHVHPVLVACAEAAIAISTQDFSVAEGCRSLAQERLNVAKGTSRTLNSMHLIQPDGFGHAVDLVPYDNGALDWNWAHIYPIVRAMHDAATSAGVAGKIRWGGVWDERLNDIDVSSDAAIAAAVHAYTVRHAGSDLLDGVHFEIHP